MEKKTKGVWEVTVRTRPPANRRGSVNEDIKKTIQRKTRRYIK